MKKEATILGWKKRRERTKRRRHGAAWRGGTRTWTARRLSTKGNGGYERGSPNEFKYLNYKSRARVSFMAAPR